MRPVNKGEAPTQKFVKYQEAEPYLEERLGTYCSFCELPIKHVPEVEHIEAKAEGGSLTDWDNLLLSCKYCNTRKSTKIKKGEKGQCLWPDEDDTFHPYTYSNGIPQINLEFLAGKDTVYSKSAENLFALVNLGNIPSPREKDRRFMERNEAYNNALISKDGWVRMKECDEKEIYLDLMICLAKNTGFFSTWMEVFKDDETVKYALIKGFRGTRESIFT